MGIGIGTVRNEMPTCITCAPLDGAEPSIGNVHRVCALAYARAETPQWEWWRFFTTTTEKP
jgi:hypothetical protein